jgi:uncharacterized membrane protein
VTILAFFSAIVIVVGLLWVLDARNGAARDAALKIETAKEVQRQRAAYDAPGVAQSAAQDVPKRKHRKKL